MLAHASSGRLLVLVLASALAEPALADPADELARLRQESARMRQSLDDLDARIRTLEDTRPAESAYVVLQRKWSDIQLGTSKEQVDALLGRPWRVMRINGDVVWYYVYPGLGGGSVFFDGEERVSSAQSPRLGWSW